MLAATHSKDHSLRSCLSPPLLVCAMIAWTATPRFTAVSSASSISCKSKRNTVIAMLFLARPTASMSGFTPSSGCTMSFISYPIIGRLWRERDPHASESGVVSPGAAPSNRRTSSRDARAVSEHRWRGRDKASCHCIRDPQHAQCTSTGVRLLSDARVSGKDPVGVQRWDIRERFPQRLGNHAQNARFPHFHSASSPAQWTRTTKNRGHLKSVIFGLGPSALTLPATHRMVRSSRRSPELSAERRVCELDQPQALFPGPTTEP
jgi:hypothetical protein